MTARDRVKAELNQIADANGGLIRPTQVIAFARDESTELHKHFQWDDTKAAAAYRLSQARSLIRIHVVQVPDRVIQVRAFVSLESDRHKDGGYRAIDSVMQDEERRAELLATAIKELQAFRRKYAMLQEFAQVFAAADKVTNEAGQARADRAG